MTQIELPNLWATPTPTPTVEIPAPTVETPTHEPTQAVPRDQSSSRILRECAATITDGGRRDPLTTMVELSKLMNLRHRLRHHPFTRRPHDTDQDLAERIRRCHQEEQETHIPPFPENIKLDNATIVRCATLLGQQTSNHVEATLPREYTALLERLFRGDFGQYLTPPNLTDFAAACMDPQPHELVMDPACGSGGFLTAALAHMRRNGDQQPAGLFGIERDAALAGIARTKLMLQDTKPYGLPATVLDHDALDLMENLNLQDPKLAPDQFDVILTNPPFGQNITEKTHGQPYLHQFESARYGTKRTPPSIRSETAFLDRVHTLLKPGTGRAAVMVPDGLLSNTSTKKVRDWMLARFQLQAVISLPRHALNHMGSGVKASFLFLRKLAQNETVADDTPIFMAIVDSVGYDSSGRPTWDKVTTEAVTPGYEQFQVEECDLFHQRTRYHWTDPQGWTPTGTQGMPNTGLVPFPLEYALYRIFVSPVSHSRASRNPELEAAFQYQHI